MVAIGTIIGGGIAFAIYLLTVVSVPMLMNERTDFFTAIGVGLKAVNQNFGAMVLWAWLIAVITAAGVATFFIGLASCVSITRACKLARLSRYTRRRLVSFFLFLIKIVIKQYPRRRSVRVVELARTQRP